MKRVLFLINTLTGGGAEKVLVDLVNNLDSETYDITVQTVSDVGIYKEQLNKNIHYKTMNNIKNKFLRKIKSYLLIKILPAKFVYNHYVKDNYDIEIAFLEGVPTKILSYSENNKKIAWVHTDLYNYYGHKKIFKNIEENIKCYKNYHKIICVSKMAKEGFKKRFGFDENVIVQYNPVDEVEIQNKSLENICEINLSSKFRMITVGRLVQQKGYDRLLHVHKKLIDEGFDYELLILGEGSEREKLEKYIKDNGLKNSVHLLGFQRNPYKFMKNSDLFVCSSYAEGYSTVVTEATILGIPTVTTDCSGMKELFGSSEYGLIVDNSEDGLYNGLKKILNDRQLLNKYKIKAEERGKTFKLKNFIAEIEEILNT